MYELRSGIAAPVGRLAVRQSPRLMAALCVVAGLWLMVDEAHVTTIGVHPAHRGQGVGDLLFLGLSDLALDIRGRIAAKRGPPSLPA